MAKPTGNGKNLRERAEAKRSSLQERDLLRYLPQHEEKSLLHELQVHQIELEMQNEEMKKTLQQLEESRDRYSELYDFAPVGYLTLDTYGMIFEANLTAAAQLNISRGDLTGRYIQSFMDRESADAFHVFLRKRMQPGEKETFECRIQPKGGRPAEFTVTATGEFTHTGNLIRYRVILMNVSRVRQMERQAVEAGDKLRLLTQALNLAEEHTRRAIAKTLHDSVSQTLAMARMKLSAAQGSSGEAPTRENIEEVLELLTGVLNESRSLMTEISPPVLNEFGLEAGVDWLAEKISSKSGIAVRTEKTGDYSTLGHNEQIMLYQIVRELLTNVVKHSGGSQAELSFRRVGDDVRITVRDDGKGFDANVARKAPGTGFGLLNIRERLTACKGSMKIESAPGQGTTVWIQVPLFKKKAKS